jgi:hypothetical protein
LTAANLFNCCHTSLSEHYFNEFSLVMDLLLSEIRTIIFHIGPAYMPLVHHAFMWAYGISFHGGLTTDQLSIHWRVEMKRILESNFSLPYECRTYYNIRSYRFFDLTLPLSTAMLYFFSYFVISVTVNWNYSDSWLWSSISKFKYVARRWRCRTRRPAILKFAGFSLTNPVNLGDVAKHFDYICVLHPTFAKCASLTHLGYANAKNIPRQTPETNDAAGRLQFKER